MRPAQGYEKRYANSTRIDLIRTGNLYSIKMMKTNCNFFTSNFTKISAYHSVASLTLHFHFLGTGFFFFSVGRKIWFEKAGASFIKDSVNLTLPIRVCYWQTG